MTVRRLLRWVVGAAMLAVGACAGLLLYMQWATVGYIYPSAAQAPATQAALLLGASILPNGTLSPVLAERANEAIILYNAHKVTKILVTGDDATVSYNEVDPVGRYLLAAGIPKKDIFLDHAGFDTYSSVYRAQSVFDVVSMTIVSQPFHLPRAVFIARTLGMVAYGVDASEGEPYWYNTLREFPASVKAAYDLVTLRMPQYLGQQYPITGDGSATWVGTTTPIH